MPSLTTDQQRLYAIGDIHGRFDLLSRLLELITADAANYPAVAKTIIFLGDYIDRGPDSRNVLRCLQEDLPKDLTSVFLRGNHEQVLLDFTAGDDAVLESWLYFGGTATLASYGLNLYGQRTLSPAIVREQCAEKIPAAHWQFLHTTCLSHTVGSYYFVHAGVRPGVPLPQQSAQDQLWIRQEFLSSRADHGAIIIHGHTISSHGPDIQPNRIGIDTGAYATGRLTCLVLQDEQRRFLST
jgi:serine/threonine protein phosphatase 1